MQQATFLQALQRLPTATLQPVDGEQHSVAADVLAPVLRQFSSVR